MSLVQRPFCRPVPNPNAFDSQVNMVTDAKLEGRGGLYYNNDLGGPTGHQFLEQPPSEEARDATEAAALWAYSAKLVGIAA